MLRVSDLRELRYDDVQGDHVSITQQKTGKVIRVRLTDTAKRIIAAVQRLTRRMCMSFSSTLSVPQASR